MSYYTHSTTLLFSEYIRTHSPPPLPSGHPLQLILLAFSPLHIRNRHCFITATATSAQHNPLHSTKKKALYNNNQLYCSRIALFTRTQSIHSHQHQHNNHSARAILVCCLLLVWFRTLTHSLAHQFIRTLHLLPVAICQSLVALSLSAPLVCLPPSLFLVLVHLPPPLTLPSSRSLSLSPPPSPS